MVVLCKCNSYIAYMSASLLQQRLARIVEVVFGGSSNAAAVAASVEPSTLHRLLEGKVADPRVNTVRKLADAFGVPTAWLLGLVTTESAQGDELPLPEVYWLLRSFHRRRQREDREILKYAASGAPNQVRERLVQLDLMPASEGFPLKSVSHLLRELPADDPERVQIERDFAELEGRIIAMAARVAVSDEQRRRLPQSSPIASITDEE